MTSSLDDRKNAFEAKFGHDQQLQFPVEARACKLFGLSLASKMGLAGNDASAYASSLVTANLDQPGLDDVIEKALTDLKAKGMNIDGTTLRHELESCLITAKEQVMNETA